MRLSRCAYDAQDLNKELSIDKVISLFQIQFAHSTLDIQKIPKPLVEIMFSKSASTVFLFFFNQNWLDDVNNPILIPPLQKQVLDQE